MARADIQAGICGFRTSVLATAERSRLVSFTVETDCETVAALAAEAPAEPAKVRRTTISTSTDPRNLQMRGLESGSRVRVADFLMHRPFMKALRHASRAMHESHPRLSPMVGRPGPTAEGSIPRLAGTRGIGALRRNSFGHARGGKGVRVHKGVLMTRYLIQASYTAEGVRGLLKDGGSSRRAAVDKMIEGLGGVSECFYFAFGENDVYAIAQLPDNATAAAVSLAITASGAVTSNVVVLLTPEEVDEAARKTVAYRAPGA